MNTMHRRCQIFQRLLLMMLAGCLLMVCGKTRAQGDGGSATGKEQQEEKLSPLEAEGEGKEREKMPSAGEAARSLEKTARHQLGRGVVVWRSALRSLTARKFSGWLLLAFLVLSGLALLFAGWSLVNSTFVLLATAIGAGTGGYLGLQACLVLEPSTTGEGKATCLVLGAVFGIVLYLGTSLRARPIAWMLVVSAPFVVLSAAVYPVNGFIAVLAACGGLGMGLVASLRRRALTTVSTAMFGALLLTFCTGLIVYLLDIEKLHNAFDKAVAHPLLLGLGVVLLIFIGTDLQLMLSKKKE